jgi:hypothetical protein
MQPEVVHSTTAAIATTSTAAAIANGSPLSLDSNNNNNISIHNPPSFRKTIASSLSFRRKRQKQQQQQKNNSAFVCLVRSARNRRLLANILFMLFVLSFCGAYLLSQQQQSSLTITRQRKRRNNNNNKYHKSWIASAWWLSSPIGTSFPFLFSSWVHNNNNHNNTMGARRKNMLATATRRNRRVGASLATSNNNNNNNMVEPQPSPSIQQPPPSSHDVLNTTNQQLRRGHSSQQQISSQPRRIDTDTTAATTIKKPVGTFLRGKSTGSVALQNMPWAVDSPNAPASCQESITDVEFTLVSQLSWNRLWMMEHHCERWKQDMSIAIYIGNNETTTSSIITKESILQELVAMGCRDDIRVTLVSGYSDQEYPVNVLRNRALDAVRTSHVVYLDVDFWPSVDLHDVLQLHVELLKTDPKQALVIPAFQLNRQCREWRDCRENNIPLMAQQKSELLDLVIAHKGSPFDPTNAGGHGSTRYQDWLTQKTDELVEIPCVLSNRYEPYLVFRYCRELPPFQEAFTGYGKNKMTWMMQLRRNGYRFSQIGTAFCIHYPHLDSKARMYWNGGEGGVQIPKPKITTGIDLQQFKRGQIDETFVQFRTWLEQHVPDRTVVGKCQDNSALDDDERLWVDHRHLPQHHHVPSSVT